jgi:TPP-dependent pyruvate/acetoin dehydrogenase alpha subunit
MRMHGHAAHDDMKYVPVEQVEEWRKKDPIDRQVKRLEGLGVDVQAVREGVKAEIEAAVQEALAMPMPDGETATHRVFADEPALLEDGNAPWSGFAAAGEAPTSARRAPGEASP